MKLRLVWRGRESAHLKMVGVRRDGTPPQTSSVNAEAFLLCALMTLYPAVKSPELARNPRADYRDHSKRANSD